MFDAFRAHRCPAFREASIVFDSLFSSIFVETTVENDSTV